jgi:hypothetical protein
VKRKRLFGSSDWGGAGICMNKRETKGGYRSFVALYCTVPGIGTKSGTVPNCTYSKVLYLVQYVPVYLVPYSTRYSAIQYVYRTRRVLLDFTGMHLQDPPRAMMCL